MSSKNMLLATLPLASQAKPTSEEILTQLKNLWKDHESDITLTSETENMVTFTCGPIIASYTFVNHPIPWQHLEGPCARATHWPAATETLKEHPYHLLVMCVDESKKSFERAINFSNFVLAILRTSDNTLGLVWGTTGAVFPPQGVLEEFSQNISVDSMPLFVWIDFCIEQNENNPTEYRLFTTGLKTLWQMEIEVASFRGESHDLLSHIYNIAHHLISEEKKLNEGDTFGLSDTLQVSTREGESMLNDGTTVLQVTYEAVTESSS